MTQTIARKVALITGFSGQDGTFLTRLLLDKGYKVIGLTRRISTEPPLRVRGRFDFAPAIARGDLVLEEGDLLSRSSLDRIINTHEPHEIYNLAAQSHVGISFKQPEFTIEADFMGVVNLLEALCAHGLGWRMYQASTSEMFGDRTIGIALDEDSGFAPNSPYSIAKTAAHFYCRMKRQQGYFVVNGILFNHESEIRGGDFVTQKIVRGVVARELDPKFVLELGNLDARRDWGYAGDYVEAMQLMLQQAEPSDFCVGTGVARTIREFAEIAVSRYSKKIVWQGSGADEVGLVDGEVFIRVNAAYLRPNDVNYLLAESSKARNILGWTPKTSFEEMVARMIDAERERRKT